MVGLVRAMVERGSCPNWDQGVWRAGEVCPDDGYDRTTVVEHSA
jgi:hypothetical protein